MKSMGLRLVHFQLCSLVQMTDKKKKKRRTDFVSRSVFQRHDVPVPTQGAVGTWVSDVYTLHYLAPVIDAFRWVLRRFNRDFTWHEDYILEELKDVLEGSGVCPCDYFPRFKEGGVVVYFKTLEDAQLGISYFHTHKFRNRTRKVFLVEGTPWLEDMLNLRPSPKIRVTPATFKSTLAISEENLYSEMRVYGTLKAMEMDPKQEFCLFTYRSQPSAVSARICLHMKEVATKQFIRVTYEPYSRFQWISKLMSNPRVTVPVIAIGGTFLSYLLIDPVRLLNVVGTLTNRVSDAHIDDIPETPESEQLAHILSNAPSGAGVLLVGAPEARQLALEKVSNHRWFVVSVNLTPEGNNKVSDTIQELCNQIGFFPTFNHLSRLFEYFQAMIPGTKPTTAQGNVEEQLQSILRVLTMALKIVSRTYPADGRSFPYALVVLDFQSTLSEAGNPSVVPTMQQWALDMMRQKIAHVVVTADSNFTLTSDSTRGALRNHSYVVHRVHDLPKDAVKKLLEPLFEERNAEGVVDNTLTEDLERYLLEEQGVTWRESEEKERFIEQQSAAASEEKGGILSFIKVPAIFGGTGLKSPDNMDLPGDHDEAEGMMAPPPPPPPPPPPVVLKVEPRSQGLWQQMAGLLEKVVLRRSRDIFERYAGKEKAQVEIPMEGLTLDSLADLVFSVVGGRLPDVVKFVTRVQSTRKSPLEVLKSLQDEAEADILNRGFGKKLFAVQTPGSWTQPQLWKCIKAIVAAEKNNYCVPLAPLVLSVFKGDKTALQALINTGVLQLEESGGTPLLTAGSPLFLGTFLIMVKDPAIRKGMEQMVLDAEYNEWTTEAIKLEDDLSKIGKVGDDLDYDGREGLTQRKSQLGKRLGELAVMINNNRQIKKNL